jgi:hypothetical protein
VSARAVPALLALFLAGCAAQADEPPPAAPRWGWSTPTIVIKGQGHYGAPGPNGEREA